MAAEVVETEWSCLWSWSWPWLSPWSWSKVNQDHSLWNSWYTNAIVFPPANLLEFFHYEPCSWLCLCSGWEWSWWCFFSDELWLWPCEWPPCEWPPWECPLWSVTKSQSILQSYSNSHTINHYDPSQVLRCPLQTTDFTVEQKEADDIGCQSDTADNQNQLRIVDFRALHEALNGLDEDGEAERAEKYGIDQCSQDFGPSPSKCIFFRLFFHNLCKNDKKNHFVAGKKKPIGLLLLPGRRPFPRWGPPRQTACERSRQSVPWSWWCSPRWARWERANWWWRASSRYGRSCRISLSSWFSRR